MVMQQRAVIRFLTLKGLKAKDIYAELAAVSGTDAYQFGTMKAKQSQKEE
jgi:hypothetical protein